MTGRWSHSHPKDVLLRLNGEALVIESNNSDWCRRINTQQILKLYILDITSEIFILVNRLKYTLSLSYISLNIMKDIHNIHIYHFGK